MRSYFLLVLLVACHHDETHAERDTKGRSSATMGRDPVATTTPQIAEPMSPEEATVHRVPLGSSPAIGGKSPLVTIVSFGDFQCNFCQRADKTMATLRGKYGDDLRVVWKNEPMAMHPRAKPAAELAMDAYDQHKDFWAVHDDLFAAQSSLDDAALARIAAAHGVKPTNKHHASLDDDHQLAASLGVTATPVFFVNGRKVVGAQSADAFSKVIDEELTDAKARIASGTQRDKVYDDDMASAE